ncbi:MAG: hypothetical protein FJ109_16970 [Deltaproteobacteria bacterium]|nr:hypothetical protein [Deltaproteobacteria bacterium]
MGQTTRTIGFRSEEWRDLPESVSARLAELARARWNHTGLDLSMSHSLLAEHLAGTGAHPWTVLIYCEILAPEHWTRKAFVRITRERIVSELDEKVWRCFSREIEDEVRRAIANKVEPDDRFIEALVEKRRPLAARILKAEYQEFHPRSWKKKWGTGRHRHERLRVRRERRFDLPPPFDWWDARNPFQQYFFVPEAQWMAVGGSGSSGQREMHSRMGFTFAAYRKAGPVPSLLLAYDRHNRLRFVGEFGDLCLEELTLGMNYHVDRAEQERLLRGVGLVRAGWHQDDWSKVDLAIEWAE